MNGFVNYPRATKDNPSDWQSTNNIDIPIGEMSSQFLVITLPSKSLRECEPFFNRIFDLYDQAIQIIVKYLNFPLVNPFRIVFDVELSGSGPSVGYPLKFHIQDIKPLLQDPGPSPKVYALFSLIALLSLRQDCFDSDLELTLSEMAAKRAFEELFNGSSFAKQEFPIASNPALLKSLKEIQVIHGDDVISETLKKFQSPDYIVTGIPPDSWIDFVVELCRVTNTNLIPLLEKS